MVVDTWPPVVILGVLGVLFGCRYIIWVRLLFRRCIGCHRLVIDGLSMRVYKVVNQKASVRKKNERDEETNKSQMPLTSPRTERELPTRKCIDLNMLYSRCTRK